MNTISEKIHFQVLQLNSNWFDQKQSLFIQEKDYDKKTLEIHVTIPESIGYDEYGDSHTFEERVFNIDFQNYCWDDSFPGSLRDQNGDNLDYPIQGRTVASNIIEIVSTSVHKVSSDETKYAILMSAYTAMLEQCIKLKTNGFDKEKYGLVLDEFYFRCQSKMFANFSDLKYYHLLSVEYQFKERLTFRLKQPELAALLLILHRADFFHHEAGVETDFMDFCTNRFYCYNQKEKAYTKAKGLKNEYYTVKKSIKENKSKSPLSEVSRILTATIKEL
jgi:hypothetical protein